MREKSCGAVLFRQTGPMSFRYLIVKDRNGNYSFPKGHMENNETEEETALREIEEEVGIKPNLDTNFRKELNYKLPNGNDKKSVYFVGEFHTGKYKCCDDEISEIMVVGYRKALELLTYDNLKELLNEARDYIKNTYGVIVIYNK